MPYQRANRRTSSPSASYCCSTGYCPSPSTSATSSSHITPARLHCRCDTTLSATLTTAHHWHVVHAYGKRAHVRRGIGVLPAILMRSSQHSSSVVVDQASTCRVSMTNLRHAPSQRLSTPCAGAGQREGLLRRRRLNRHLPQRLDLVRPWRLPGRHRRPLLVHARAPGRGGSPRSRSTPPVGDCRRLGDALSLVPGCRRSDFSSTRIVFHSRLSWLSAAACSCRPAGSRFAGHNDLNSQQMGHRSAT